MSDTGGHSLSGPKHESNLPVVVRSEVLSGLPYKEYKQYLRHDFFYSCAYCSMSEGEARAIRFTIDHYEPKSVKPELENEYGNLMYACDECNTRKGDSSPPPNAREAGFRYFRPDQDIYSEHFKLSGIRLEEKSPVGYYTIESLDLNRLSLRRLREIRERLIRCDHYVAEGVLALTRFSIDRIPREVRTRALKAIGQALTVANDMVSDIDTLLRTYAKSDLVDPEPHADARAKQRAEKMRHLHALFPGRWRGRYKGRK